MKRLITTLMFALPACAAQSKCKDNPKVVAACFAVHGRASLGADTVRIYIWPIGTKRMLGVTGGPTLDDQIEPIYTSDLRFDSDGDDILGDFEVCPFTPQKRGHLQLVCVESATHLVVTH
jgi:hypothetical protein